MSDVSREGTVPTTQQPSDSNLQQEQEAKRASTEAVKTHQVAAENPQQPSTMPASASNGEGKPAVNRDRKWTKPLLIVVVCVLVLAIVVGAYFVWQTGEKRSIASAAVDQLKGSEAVAGLVIPSEWGDQTGFSVGGVDVDSVESGILPGGNAQVAIKADIDNGHYAGQAQYDIAMKKDGPSWVADDIKQTALNYYPVSGISDEALLSRIPELVGEAYSFLVEEDTAYPDPTTLFGEGSAGEVVSNAFENLSDDVEMTLSAQRDGNTYQGSLSLSFEWIDAGEEQPDWHLVIADLDEEAYLIAGSFLSEGVEMGDDYEPLGQEEWLLAISKQLDFRDGSQYAWAFLENPADSSVDISVTIELDDGQVIYTSPRIPPNHEIEAIRADWLPGHGVYDAKAYFRAYEGRTQVGDGIHKIRVIVS